MSIINRNNISKTIQYLKKNGISDTVYAAQERIALKRKDAYIYTAPDKETLEMQTFYSLNYDLSGVEGDKCKPVPQGTEEKIKITVVMPAYETPAVYLTAAIDSVIAQSYPFWELVIADASKSNAVWDVVSAYDNVRIVTAPGEGDTNREFASKTIIYTRLKDNLGISENTNATLEFAIGDYVALMDHDDTYTPDALFRIAVAAAQSEKSENEAIQSVSGKEYLPNGPALIYSDEDKTDSEGNNFYDPHIKYDFNYDLLLTNNYICHLCCVRRDIFENIRFRKEYDGAQDYDLVLQIAQKLIEDNRDLRREIVHVPAVLYHWRCHEASTAANTSSKLYAYESGLKALRNHVDNLYSRGDCNNEGGAAITVKHSKHLGFYKITYGCDGLFDIRPDVGAVIGRHFDRRGGMLPILWDENGNSLYEGIYKHFAGELNRFDCSQEVAVADIRYMKLNPALTDTYIEYLGRAENMKREDNRDTAAWYKLSYELAAKLHKDGYKILYIPDLMSEK